MFAETGSSDNPCSNLYAGEYAFSEPESHSVSMFLQSNNLRGKLDVFITLHTYAQFWIHPYSHLRRKYPTDVDDILGMAEKATKKLKQIYGTEYHVGTGADLLSPAAGGSDDWAKDILGVKYVYLLELRPNNNMKNGFILDRSELLPVGVETLEGLKVIFDSVLKQNSTSSQPSAYSLSVNNTLDIRRLSSNAPSNPFNQHARSTQPSRWNTIYIPRTPHYTTPITTTATASTNEASTLSSTTTTAAAPTIKILSATAMTTTTTTNAREEKSLVAPVAQTGSEIDAQTTTSKEGALDILKNLPFETRKQLSEELLKKQLMRIKNLAMMNTTPILPSTLNLKNAASELEIASVLSTQTVPYSTLLSSTPLNSTALPSTIFASRYLSTTTRPSTQIDSTSTTRKTSESCVDKKYSCAFWINADKKACHAQKRFMETNCALSCGYCNKE
uniref:ShKT domain-containing protein n=1 Tax=Bursaphelenchus xylophilus TaxID=6326 RepID=A0A1I7SDT5_BURXY